MKKGINKFLKIIAYFFGFILILLIIAYFFIQTDTFNKLALQYTLKELNNSLTTTDNKINAESLEGDVLTGLRLNHGNVLIKNDTLLSFEYADVKYNVWDLLRRQISIEHLILVEPKININRVKGLNDSLIWNYANLFKSRVEQDTVRSVFDWDVDIEHLKIERGFFRIIGDTSKIDPAWKQSRELMNVFDLYNSDLFNVEMDLDAKYYKDFKQINLKHLSFNTNSEFNLRKLAFNAKINIVDSTTELWGLELVTDRSIVKIHNLNAKEFNPLYDFSYEDLGNKYIDVNLNIEKFNFDDLTFFIPDIGFLDSAVSLQLSANGKYGDLNVNSLYVQLPNSNINIKGRVKNLHAPDSLYLDVVADNLDIFPPDVMTIYTDAGLPDFSRLGIVDTWIKYTGTVSDFYSEYRVNSAAGYFEGDLKMNTDYETYSGFLNTKNLNPGYILNDRSMNGNVNLSAKFNGTGFDERTISASVDYSMTGSRLAGYSIRSSYGRIKYAGNNINLNIHHYSSMGNAVASGRVNISNPNNPSYVLKGNVSSFDISGITRDASDRSNLNFSFDVNGRGISPENINGVYKLNFADSRYGEYTIPETPVDAEIMNSGEAGKINISTDLADINAEGKFNIGEIIEVVANNIAQVSNKYGKYIDPDVYQNSEVSAANNEVDISYKIVTKDSIKLRQALEPFGIEFIGSLRGNIKNSSDRFTSSNVIDAGKFVYRDTTFVLNNVQTDLIFNNNYLSAAGSFTPDLEIKMLTHGDRILIEGQKIDSVNLDLQASGPDAFIYFAGRQDTGTYALIRTNLLFEPDLVRANFDSVNVNYAGYNARNSGNWLVNYTPMEKIAFEQFIVKSREAEVAVAGIYSFNDNSDLKISSNDLELKEIYSIVNNAETLSTRPQSYPIKGKIENLEVYYKGRSDNPEITAKFNTNTLTYGEEKLGIIKFSADYKNNDASGILLINNSEGKGTLTVKGNVPVVNPFSTDSGFVMDYSASPVNVSLIAKNFQLDYFSRIIPGVSSLGGVMNADLTAIGAASDPNLSGSIKIDDGFYYLPLTGMTYSYKVGLKTNNYKLVVEDFMLYNEDDKSRHIDLFGDLDFKDMKIKDINLAATGDMVILDKYIDANELGVYGYILGGIGTPQFTIKGTMDTLVMRGQFLVKEADISSLPLKGSGYSLNNDNFVYIDGYADTVQAPIQQVAVSEDEFYRTNPFKRSGLIIDKNSKGESTLDLDINVKTEEDLFVTIDFNNITRDRLVGDVKADLNIKTENGNINAYGQVEVTGDSYYRFYRDFKVSESTIRFNGDIANPILDIRAVYEGQKTTEQFGSTTTSDVDVVVTITGEIEEPEINLKLLEDGNEVQGSDAQSDALTFLLFGKFKSDLSNNERTAVASSLGSSVGSLYFSSYLSQSIREILPFIVDATFKYEEGGASNTDIELVSEIGDARVKFGGKLLKEDRTVEFAVNYPLNQLLNLNLPEKLLLELSREEVNQSTLSNSESVLTTQLKLLYKIKF